MTRMNGFTNDPRWSDYGDRLPGEPKAPPVKMPLEKFTQEMVKRILRYDDNSGMFFWRKPPSFKNKEGDLAGYIVNNQYWVIGLHGQKITCARLVWMYHFNRWPNGRIFFKNGNTLDSRLENLYEKDELTPRERRKRDTEGMTKLERHRYSQEQRDQRELRRENRRKARENRGEFLKR